MNKAQVLLLLLISSLIIFYKFVAIPEFVAYDEIDFARLAFSLQDTPYTPYSPIATGHATLYFYILLLSFKLFGISEFALRLPSALFGIGSVILTYFLLKTVFVKNKYIPFFLALILSSSRWFFNFARFSFEATFLLCLELSSLIFMTRYESSKKISYLVAASVFAGLAFNSYPSGRIFFVVPLFYILISNNPVRKKIKDILLVISIVFIMSFPLIYTIQKSGDPRFQKVVVRKIEHVTSNLTSTVGMLYVGGDMNGRHNYPGKPALNPILALFFTIGALAVIKNIRKKWNALFIFYFVVSIIPSLLTEPKQNPNMLRTFTVLPTIIFCIGISFIVIQNYSKKLKIKKFILPIIAVLIIISSLYELRTYFNFQAEVFHQSFDIHERLNKIVPVFKTVKSDDEFYSTIYYKLKLNEK